MSVYFVTCRELGRVKIGRTTNIKRRLQGLQTGSPAELIVEVAIDGGPDEERDLHARFAEHRISGEWFSLTPEIEKFIREHKPQPPEKKRDYLLQGERVDAFVYDPMGWLQENPGATPPISVQNWLDRQKDLAAAAMSGGR